MFSGVISYLQSRKVLSAMEWVVHTYNVIYITNQIQIIESEIETNVFDEITTGKHNSNISLLISQRNNKLDLISTLTKDNPFQTRNINVLRPLLIDKDTYLQHLLQLNEKRYESKALLLAATAKLNSLNIQSNALLQTIKSTEMQLLDIRNNSYQIAAHKNGIILVNILVFCGILLFCALVLINYHLSRRNKAEENQRQMEKKLLSFNEKLKASEERFELAVTGSRIGLWDWEVGTNKMYFSPYLKKMLGYEQNEIPNTTDSFIKHIHPADLERVNAAINQHIKYRVPYDLEYRLLKKSGNYHWYEATGQSVWDENGRAIRMVGSLFDISDRKRFIKRIQMQFAISKILSEGTNLKEIADQISQAVSDHLDFDFSATWMLDEAKEVLHCVSTWFSSDKLTAFDVESKKLTFNYSEGLPGQVFASGKSIWIDDVANDPNFVRAKSAKASGLHSGFCFPIIMKKRVIGVVEFFSADMQLADEELMNLMDAVGLQIGHYLQRKEAEYKLKESESYKNAVLTSASDSIITVDSQGIIVSSNPQSEKIFGFSKADGFSPSHIDTLMPNISASLDTFANKGAIEYKGTRGNGETFPVEISISKMESNIELLYVIVVRDITERKKVDRLKNEFVSVVSHELRTPLTSIRGSIALLLGGKMGEFPEKAMKLLNIADKNCDRLLLLINDILDIEKIESGKMRFNMQSVNINKLVHDAITNNRLYADKYHVSIIAKNTCENLLVHGDSDRLMQVLTNLISNAAKFSNANGVVEVSVELNNNNENVRISVRDHGVGISPDFRPRIFQKFSQADSSSTRGKSGSGLGLSISKAIIEKHNGVLSFESIPGQGATFYFDLPLETAKSVEQYI